MKSFLKIVTAPTVIGVVLGFGFGTLILFASGDKNITDRRLWGTTLIVFLAVAVPLSLVNWWREKKGYGACTMDDIGP
jgi:high-affinity Fe2+/Pb2+ permease